MRGKKFNQGRSVQSSLTAIRKGIIDRYLAGQMSFQEAAELLRLHPKSLSRLKRKYLLFGQDVLTPKKPGPKKGQSPANRTPEEIQMIVLEEAQSSPGAGLRTLAKKLREKRGINLHPTTILRIKNRHNDRKTDN